MFVSANTFYQHVVFVNHIPYFAVREKKILDTMRIQHVSILHTVPSLCVCLLNTLSILMFSATSKTHQLFDITFCV